MTLILVYLDVLKRAGPTFLFLLLVLVLYEVQLMGSESYRLVLLLCVCVFQSSLSCLVNRLLSEVTVLVVKLDGDFMSF